MPLDPTAKLSFLPISFSDFDQYSEWSSKIGWNIQSTQLSCGPTFIQFDHFVFPELTIVHQYNQQKIHDLYEIPRGCVAFSIPRNHQSGNWMGMEVPSSLMAIHKPGRLYSTVLPAHWDAYDFTVTESFLERTELFTPELLAQATTPERAFLPLIKSKTDPFLSHLDQWFQKARQNPYAINISINKTEFYDFILSGLHQIIEAGLQATEHAPIQLNRRSDLVKTAQDFMLTHLKENLTADEIAHRLDVSYRVLHYAFKDTFGVSPYKFFLTQKLHAVRQLLKSSDLTISEASESYGLFIPSRFSRYYKHLFGELPSVTKRKRLHQEG